MAVYELFTNAISLKLKPSSRRVYFDDSALLQNAHWFTIIRWMVAFVFIFTGLVAGLFPNFLKTLGLVSPIRWPLFLAAVVIVVNSGFAFYVKVLKKRPSRKRIVINIWMQIITDLIFVTVVIHLIGSTHSFIAFIYIFHIVLACIFFSPLGSLIVTLIASCMYITSVLLEVNRIIPNEGIMGNALLINSGNTSFMLFNAGSAIAIWIIAWYLVSTLSRTIREQDEKLTSANKKLQEANREKAMQILVTTHELKAPFAGIETNIQRLKYTYWADIPKPVCEIIKRIEKRSLTLRKRIDEILMLGNLKIKYADDNQVSAMDISEVLNSIVKSLEDLTEKNKVSINFNVPGRMVLENKEHFTLLFSNLIVNAIVYSRTEGIVDISSVSHKDGLHIYIADHGIGIKKDALPHIFDEYYRTAEGSKFNKMSTGLGLSIVKEIAKNHAYGIRVKSELNKGTSFEIIIPKKILIKEKE